MAKRIMASVKLARLEARGRVLRGMFCVVLLMFAAALGFVVVATAIPQYRELEKLEAKLGLAKQREKEVLADLEYHQIEYRALREDPEFLEIHARDRLDYYREGERILKFGKDR
jgi:hypothetical protein